MCGACRVRWTRTAGWAQTAAVKAVNRTTAVAAVGGRRPSQPTPHSLTPTVSSSAASLTCIYMYMYRYNVYTCTDTEMPAYSLIPPTPDSSGHHGNKPLLSSRKTTAVATMATSAGGQRSEVARQISYLLSPSSPLVGENLKVSAPSERATNHLSPHLTVLSLAAQVLLGAVAFGALSAGQRQQLMSLLPAVDRQHPSKCPHCLHVLSPHTLHHCLLSLILCSILPVALGNTFFGSACREWQDHLALGLHGNGGGRCRGDKKGRNHDIGWKDNFFESQWGERSAMTTLAPPHNNRMLLHALYVCLVT